MTIIVTANIMAMRSAIKFLRRSLFESIVGTPLVTETRLLLRPSTTRR